MHVQALSSGATPEHNEDWVGSFHTRHGTDLVIVDGGTSVAQRDYVDAENGDVVWFVRQFAAALGNCIEAGLGQADAVRAAIGASRAAYDARSIGEQVPAYAWPIAAMSWVRAQPGANAWTLELYCLGDCKILLRGADGTVSDLDPWVNPQEAVLRTEIARLQAEGVDDPAARQARLLPILRARRAFQNTDAAPATLCLRPAGPFQARTARFAVPPGASVLGMTDGFYRLVDTYGLHTPATLFDRCLSAGLQCAMDELRSHERVPGGAAAAVVKRADDASAILWQAGSSAEA